MPRILCDRLTEIWCESWGTSTFGGAPITTCIGQDQRHVLCETQHLHQPDDEVVLRELLGISGMREEAALVAMRLQIDAEGAVELGRSEDHGGRLTDLRFTRPP